MLPRTSSAAPHPESVECAADVAAAALKHILRNAQPGVVLKLGYGSYFARSRNAWNDVDLVFLLNDASGLRKSRFVQDGIAFDIFWCGLGGIEGALQRAAAAGQQHFAYALGRSVLLDGDAECFSAVRRQGLEMLFRSPRVMAAEQHGKLRLHIKSILQDLSRVSGCARATLCVELFQPIVQLAALERDCWIVPRAYESEWSQELRAEVDCFVSALAKALIGDDEEWLALAANQLERAGGVPSVWP